MLLAVAFFSTIGQISNDFVQTDIYSGLIIESAGVMLMLVSWFIAGGRVHSKPLFIFNVLLAGILPASFISQFPMGYLMGHLITPLPPIMPVSILLFIAVYLVICGAILYFAVIRRRAVN